MEATSTLGADGPTMLSLCPLAGTMKFYTQVSLQELFSLTSSPRRWPLSGF